MERKITSIQDMALRMFKANPDVWLKVKDVWAKYNGTTETPTNSELGSWGLSIKNLAENTPELFIERDKKSNVFKWSTEATHDVKSSFGYKPVSSKPDWVAPSLKKVDIRLISDVLLAYAEKELLDNPEKALRAAYIAGLMAEAFSTNKQSAPVKKTVGKKEEVAELEPVEVVYMPKTMSYDGFVEATLRAYAQQKFDYDTLAKKLDMGVDYLRKIIRGDAEPKRDTYARVYSSIFSV